MEYVIQNPGLEHITEMILFNLNFEGLKKCQNLNKSIKKTLEENGESKEDFQRKTIMIGSGTLHRTKLSN